MCYLLAVLATGRCSISFLSTILPPFLSYIILRRWLGATVLPRTLLLVRVPACSRRGSHPTGGRAPVPTSERPGARPQRLYTRPRAPTGIRAPAGAHFGTARCQVLAGAAHHTLNSSHGQLRSRPLAR
jgi:hypothetical protein